MILATKWKPPLFHWTVVAMVRRRDGKDKIPYKPKYLFVELYRIALWTLNLGISKLYFIIRRSRQRNVFLLLFVIHFNFFSDQKTKAKYFYLMQDPSSDSLPESQIARNFDLLLFFRPFAIAGSFVIRWNICKSSEFTSHWLSVVRLYEGPTEII